MDRLRADTAADRRWRRVHVVELPLSDYLRYECEWGYTDNAAHGEDVRITRRFTMIITHGALGWRGGSVDAMAAQLDHIAESSRRPNVRIGVIPWGVPATAFPTDGFNLYDERLVIVGTTTATAHITDRRDVIRYTALLNDLTAMAVFDDDARTLLTDTAATYTSAGRMCDDLRMTRFGPVDRH